MLKRVKRSLSNTQKQDVKDAVFYIYCKMFCEILPKIKALPLAFVVSQNDWIVGKLIILEDYKMKQHYLDERTGISYTLQGDYYLHDLALPTEKEPKPIGIWGQQHLWYIKRHRKVLYTNLLTSRLKICFFGS